MSDINELSEAIELLIKDEKLANSLSVNAFLLKENLSVEIISNLWEHLFD